MTDDIITDLSKLSGILVIARNSSWTYKGKSVKVQQVAKDLGVRYVLEGSVRREGDTVRINAQLVDALGGQHLWAERYDGSIRDVFALQDKVIGQIVAALAVNLTHDERTSVELAETKAPKPTMRCCRAGHTIAGAPRTKPTRRSHCSSRRSRSTLSTREHMPPWRRRPGGSSNPSGSQPPWADTSARLTACKQLSSRRCGSPMRWLTPCRAEVLSKQGHYDEAFTEIDRAMALAPNDSDNYLSKARILNATGRAAQAEESVRWAMRLDPLYSPRLSAHARDFAFPPATLRGSGRDHREGAGSANRYRGRLHHADCEPWISWSQEWRPRGYQEVQ